MRMLFLKEFSRARHFHPNYSKCKWRFNLGCSD